MHPSTKGSAATLGLLFGLPLLFGAPAAGAGDDPSEAVPIAAAVRFSVAPEHAAAFEEAMMRRSGDVEAAPGFLSHRLLRPVQPGEPYVVLSFWASRAAYDAYRTSPAWARAHGRDSGLPPTTFSDPPVMEIHEVADHTVAAPASPSAR